MSHYDEELPTIHPTVLATDQVSEAILDLDRHPDRYLRWPFPDLDALTGPLGCGGDIWIVAAYSGGGKTTFVTSAITRWREQGKRIYAMPLETRSKRFRTYLACMDTGIHPGDALSGQLRTMPGGEEQRERLKAALLEQTRRPYVEQVMVSEQRAINVAGLEHGLKQAKAFGADVVIVDHIDHIAGGDGSNPAAESKAVNHAALRMAQDNDMLLVFTSQLNLTISRNPDHLAKYAPPRPDHMWMPGVKLQVATGIIGLYRQVRAPNPGETDEEYAALLKKARAGQVAAPDILDPHTMGINAMKLRHYGGREGARIALAYAHGKVMAMDEKDRYQTHFGGQMRRVA